MNEKGNHYFYNQKSIFYLSIWRSDCSTPVDQRDDRDPASSEADEEAWARAHGKRAISFGKYDYYEFLVKLRKGLLPRRRPFWYSEERK
ncbi:hypothetical protein DP119_13560 [Planococcus maitriensis]|uniref:Uncharacterized protein n=1 Tax=Planococcus maitriensis TaxID=221799 RepID=A0A365K1W1_9BACL|nr:hypothetical protein DP119_13560 [Planococcus maitriensis]